MMEDKTPMATITKLCVFASTLDMEGLEFPVKVLSGSLPELAERSIALGYDGIELLPNPEAVPDAATVARALDAAGAIVPVVNSGRFGPQGLALLHRDPDARRRAFEAFCRLVDLAAELGARVGLGMARGGAAVAIGDREIEAVMLDVFGRLAVYAEQAGTVVMLEPADPGISANVHTVAEASLWADRIGSRGFSVMLDTYQLTETEESLEAGIAAAGSRPTHIHLYDPSRWPPGVRDGGDRLDWPAIMAQLARQGFSGTGSVVLAPEGDVEDAAARSVAYLRGLA